MHNSEGEAESRRGWGWGADKGATQIDGYFNVDEQTKMRASTLHVGGLTLSE